MALNARQQLFVAHYLKTKNATESAKLAGYSEKTAHVIGPRLLGNVAVKALLEQKVEKVTNKLELSAEKVLSRISEFAFGIEHCEPRDALKANELLGKHLKLFTENIDVNVKSFAEAMELVEKLNDKK